MKNKTNRKLLRSPKPDMEVLTSNDRTLLNNYITENRKLLKMLSKL